MRSPLSLSALVLLAAFAPAADAVAQATPGMELAGGSVRGAGTFAGGSEIGIKVSAAGDAVTIRAAGAIGCGDRTSTEGHGVGTGPVGADGSFSVVLEEGAQRGEPGFRSGVTAVGRITGDRATGALQINNRRRNRRACAGSLPYAASVTPDLGSAAAAPPPAGATLIGRAGTALAPSGAPFGFNLRVSGNGRTVSRGVFGYFQNWRGGGLKDLEETNYVPRMRIRSDGTFSGTDRYTARFTDGTERSSVRTTGRFVAGGAVGTTRWTSTFRNRRGRVVARGTSGLIRWTAAP